VAAVVQRDGSGRVALGGVAYKPWREAKAEAQLGSGAKAVIGTLLADAKPTEHNAFKVTLAERALASILAEARS